MQDLDASLFSWVVITQFVMLCVVNIQWGWTAALCTMPVLICTWTTCLGIFPWPLFPQHTQTVPWGVLCKGQFVSLTQFTGPSQHPSPLPFITLASLLCPHGFLKEVLWVAYTSIATNLVCLIQSTFLCIYFLLLLSGDDWGWRGTQFVMTISISIAEINSCWQNGPEKFKIPCIKKIVWHWQVD